MLELGTQAPGFELPNLNTRLDSPAISLADFNQQAVIVCFICNHCPYVVLIASKLAELAVKWRQSGVNMITISSNDVDRYPADAPEKMAEFALKHGFECPYLYDESQQVARDYRAACTPDIFLFNARHQLVLPWTV